MGATLPLDGHSESIFCLFLQPLGTRIRGSEKAPRWSAGGHSPPHRLSPGTHTDPSRNIHTGLVGYFRVWHTWVCMFPHDPRFMKIASGFYWKTVSPVVDSEEGEERGQS